MENDSLNDLFVALSSPEDEIRKQAECFVLNLLEEQKEDFIEKILYELVNNNPTLNQVWYSFIIIKKSIWFYEDYPKVINTSLLYFGHENEQVRMISAFTFCLYSKKVLEITNDQTSIQLLLSNINPSSDFYVIESTIRSIATMIKIVPKQNDVSVLIDYLFDFFIQSETAEKDTLLILAINDIIPLISESYIIEGGLIQKLLYLININQLKSSVYMILTTIADYFYLTGFLNEIINQILEVSCHDLSEINDTDIVMRILSFWNKIARIEYDASDNELNFLYVNRCAESLTPYLVEVLSKHYDADYVEEKTDWKPLQASRETIKLFCLISFNMISPILFQFLNESDDVESNFFVLSIIIQTMPENEENKSQVQAFLNTIFSEISSSNVCVRYSALYALDSIVSRDFFQPQEFDPFLEIYVDEWTDVEQNACKSFKIFTKICSKMPIEKEAEFIIQSLQNIEQMPIQYISFYLKYICKNNFNNISSDNSELICQLLTFFSTFLENSNNEYKSYEIAEKTISIMQKLFIPDLNLDSIFNDILNLLMRTFSEFNIPVILMAISYLFQSDRNSSLPHLQAMVEFFISLLNESQSLTPYLLKATTSALLLVIYIDIEDMKIINDVYTCISNLMLKVVQENENNEDDNLFLIYIIFEFFGVILLIREIEPEILDYLFKIIKKYFSLSETEMHDIVLENSSFFNDILEFIVSFISNCPQNMTDEYFEIINSVCSSIDSLNYKTKDMADKYQEIQNLLAQLSKEEE